MHTTHDLVSAPYGQRGDLIANIESPRYVLIQHRLEAGAESALWMNPKDARSFIVIEGEVEVDGERGERVDKLSAAPGVACPTGTRLLYACCR